MDFYCEVCGSSLSETINNLRQVVIAPCEKCLEREKDAGYEEGFDVGKEEAQSP